MSTIRDVAKRAGVAPITVSRVINDSGYVSDDTRLRVEQAISELNYIPNKLGPSLRSKRTNTLALVLSDITNPFWTTVSRGAEDAAHEAGYHLIFCNTDESPQKQNEYLHVLLSRQVDGFLLVPAESVGTPIELIQKQAVPVVVLDRRIPDHNVDIIRCDSEGGSYALTRHLIELGHCEIAIVTGPKEVSTAYDRANGYCRAMTEAGLEADFDKIYWGQFTQTAGYELTKRVLAEPHRPSGLVAGNNFIAIGAMRAIIEADLNVPDDISIVTFDDLPEAITIQPFFTAVSQPAYEIGFQAANTLLKRLGQDSNDFGEVVLPYDLIIRQSSGPRLG